MSWTAPRDWVAGEIVTASIMNTHVRDQVRYLKGLDGVVTTQAGLVVDNTLGTEYLKLPLLSTAECTSVLGTEGKIAQDEQTHRIKLHDGTAVRSIVTTTDVDDIAVNGAITDPISSNWAYDHIYVLTAAGDMPYATAAAAWNKVTIGAANTYLKSTGTAPSWAAGIFATTQTDYSTSRDLASAYVYTNTGGSTMLVTISAYCTANAANQGYATAYSDSNANPTTVVAKIGSPAPGGAINNMGWDAMTFAVLSGNKYKVAGTEQIALVSWVEWT